MQFVVIFLASSLPIAFGIFFLKFWRRKERLIAVAMGATCFHYAVLILFPTIYSVATNLELESRMAIDVDFDDLASVLLFEVAYAFLLLGVCMICLRVIRQRRKNVAHVCGIGNPTILYDCLIGTGWLLYVSEAFALTGVGRSQMGLNTGNELIDQVTGWMNAVLWLPSLIACALTVTQPGGFKRNTWRFLFASAPLLALVIMGVTTGLRGRITWVLSVLIIGAYLQVNRRMMIRAAIVAIVLLPVLAFIGGNYRKAYQVALSDGRGLSRSALLKSVLEEGQVYLRGGDVHSEEDFFYSFALRAQGVRNSVVLYRLYDRSLKAGWKPYIGSLLFPVPRAIFPNKLASGSLTTEAEDSAMYIVMDYAYNISGYMGPSLASANAYWENGFFWMLGAAVMSGLIWGCVLAWADTLPLYLGVLVVGGFLGSLLIDGFFTMVNPAFSLVLQFWKVLVPVYCINRLRFKRGYLGQQVHERKISSTRS